MSLSSFTYRRCYNPLFGANDEKSICPTIPRINYLQNLSPNSRVAVARLSSGNLLATLPGLAACNAIVDTHLENFQTAKAEICEMRLVNMNVWHCLSRSSSTCQSYMQNCCITHVLGINLWTLRQIFLSRHLHRQWTFWEEGWEPWNSWPWRSWSWDRASRRCGCREGGQLRQSKWDLQICCVSP